MAVARDARALLGQVRSEIREVVAAGADGTLWINAELLAWLNEGQQQVTGDLIDCQEDFFGDYFDVIGAGVSAYDLPSRFVTMRQVEYVGGGSRDPVPESRVTATNPPLLGSATDPVFRTPFAYSLYADRIEFDPAPDAGSAVTFRCWYVGEPAELTYGKASSGAASTITLQATDNAAGFAAAGEDDYYNKTWLVLTGGTGAGQRRRIVDYVGSTRIATVDPAWTTPPDSTSEYATETMIPQPFWRMVPLFGAIAAKGKYKQDARHLVSRFNAFSESIAQVLERRTSAHRGVQVFDPFH